MKDVDKLIDSIYSDEKSRAIFDVSLQNSRNRFEELIIDDMDPEELKLYNSKKDKIREIQDRILSFDILYNEIIKPIVKKILSKEDLIIIKEFKENPAYDKFIELTIQMNIELQNFIIAKSQIISLEIKKLMLEEDEI